MNVGGISSDPNLNPDPHSSVGSRTPPSSTTRTSSSGWRSSGPSASPSWRLRTEGILSHPPLPHSPHRPKLKGTLFQRDLGTMLDKSDRCEALVGLSPSLDCPQASLSPAASRLPATHPPTNPSGGSIGGGGGLWVRGGSDGQGGGAPGQGRPCNVYRDGDDGAGRHNGQVGGNVCSPQRKIEYLLTASGACSRCPYHCPRLPTCAS